MEYQIMVRTITKRPVLFIRQQSKQSEIGNTLEQSLPKVFAFLQHAGASLAGPPFARYIDWTKDKVTIEAGLPVDNPMKGAGDIEAGVLHEGKVATTTHTGSYDTLPEAYEALETWIKGQGLKGKGAPWEVYVTDPGENPEPTGCKTEIFWPIES